MGAARLILVGWVLFALSGVLFLVVAVQNGDVLGAVGCVLWLAAIGCFLLADRRD